MAADPDDDGGGAWRRASADHSLRRPHPRQRGAGGGHRASARGGRELRRGGAAGQEGSRQGPALHRRGEGRAMRLPDARGHFGRFGGRFVPETLMAPLIELEKAYLAARRDRKFQARFASLLADYAGRPTPLYFAARLTEHCGGARIWLKREDLCHTGAHKINNVLGQALLAARMKKPRVIAETGAGQHGVATATAAALLGLECEVYMGTEDIERQALNVFRMRLLGAKVIPVESGSRTLKDAVNEALRDWVTNVRTTYYLLGSALGPHPYPMMVRDFHTVIGKEARAQARRAIGRLPDVVVACVGGGGPEHAYYRDAGRFTFVSITDEEALEGFQALTRLEGIMPALESAHAVAHAMRLAKTLPKSKTIVVGLSGRGDKDVHVVAKALGMEIA